MEIRYSFRLEMIFRKDLKETKMSKPLVIEHPDLKDYAFTYGNGKKDGVHITRYPNGKVAAEITYKNGKKNGIYRTWYENGKLWRQCNYENELLNGEEKVYDYREKLLLHCNYVKDKLHGSFIYETVTDCGRYYYLETSHYKNGIIVKK